MRTKVELPKLIASPKLPSYISSTALTLVFLIFVFAWPVRSQESPPQTESVAEAARTARQHKANSSNHPKLITNADLGPLHPVPNARRPLPSASAFHLPYFSVNAAEVPDAQAASCDNPEAQRLKLELQAAEQELAQLRSELSYQPPVISDRDLDLQYFQPGNSGLNVGSPPLLDSEPPAPPRVAQVELEERIASLQRALRVACEPPDTAAIQIQIDDLEQQLNLLQRQFALDQDTYYSEPNFAEDRAGKARLDVEFQQIQSLQAQIEELRQQLAAFKVPQT